MPCNESVQQEVGLQDNAPMLLRHSSFCIGYHIEKLGLKVGSMLFAGLQGAITVKVLA